ncbi:Cardiolipin synthase B [Xanthomonas sacchari]|uniref:Cardiolipin synthase B n=1 Tax=Xanthomonas sacchari TaxID=56458 RepID=A0AA46SUH8_9XANT|nr:MULTISPECIES: cardiolipin synthase ClsB [Xanthomonas]MCW0366840.1 Cardiolipin synthase B [Xanthomonas sacchari]MCW0441249.1 Cardiolipin synthase B [Xanthomonas sacchari]MCW0463733.1 Cardiolipin synthase B [Xanthomonas sacchari]MDY4341425.1 cardiolipin synthase ClsB [Xanthomonas sp. LF07-6]UYK88761.1 cardiolipin synthase ClsB [Xanthomonas sacchari]
MNRTANRDTRWRQGHRLELLENGDAYFRCAFAAIDAARHEVLLETFIWFEDKVGLALKDHLVAAARRGVRVHLLVDAFGSPDLSPGFVRELTEAGAELRLYDQQPTLLGVRLNVFRRMHRKLLVVDGRIGMIGGINWSADHLADFGPEAKQDYAVEVQGPVVADMVAFVRRTLATHGTGAGWVPQENVDMPPAGAAEVCFLPRDNAGRSRSIERAYRQAFRNARHQIVLANAYFFPGYGFLRDLCAAARRGVAVKLIFQGQPDTPLALFAARALYRHLVDAGVQIFEYCERPFHGKVAVIDGHWSTVGSSNLDPLSLALNLEANLMIRNAAFARDLHGRLQRLMQRHCREVVPAQVPRRRFWQPLLRPLLFHVLRNVPQWASRLPKRTPRTAVLRRKRHAP